MALYGQNTLEKFKIELRNKLSSIPTDKLVEADLFTILQIVDALKYQISSDDLRQMFVELIASAFNSDNEGLLHPSYAEIIKHLSPFDAKLLKDIIQKDKHCYSILVDQTLCQNKRIDGRSDIFTIIPFYFNIPEFTMKNYQNYTVAVDNLIRLRILIINTPIEGVGYHHHVLTGDMDHEYGYSCLTNEFASELENYRKNNIPEGKIILNNMAYTISDYGFNFIKTSLSKEDTKHIYMRKIENQNNQK